MYKPVLATLGYVLSADRKSTLLVHRISRPDDQHYGKYNGLGGKVEPGEHVVSCLLRELWEEAGIEGTKLVLRGTISWPGFGGVDENWFGFVFRIDEFSGTPRTNNEDGPLEWVPISDLRKLPLWEGDYYFLPLVFDDCQQQFHGVMPYKNGRPTGWDYQRL